MKESDLQRRIRDHIKRIYGGECMKVHGGPYSEAGAADLICCLPGGRYVALEVKLPGKRATPLQEKWLARYQSVGAVTAVVASLDDVDNIILSNRN